MTSITVALAQINPLVGDIPGNTRKTLDSIAAARAAGARVVLLPELMLTGYPPEDLLLRPSLDGRIARAVAEVAAASDGILAVVGYPRRRDGVLYNMAGVFRDGELVAEYAKQLLPNYQVFDEKRYFGQGTAPCVVELDGVPLAITICEDIWQPGPMAAARDAGARAMLCINASPFHRGKQAEREQVVASRAREGAMPVVYINQVGGQDELVFDGGSMAVDAGGAVRMRAPLFAEGLHFCQLVVSPEAVAVAPGEMAEVPELLPSVYQALVTGVRDYVDKNRFKGVVLGLSGGIDSALTLAVAVDALGPERVEAVMMPFRYTSQLSRDAAAEEARRLGVRYRSLGIEPLYDAFMTTLAEEFAGLPVDLTEQNIQARARGVLLMAISNKKGLLVLTTGNKSEVAVGYCTLYGDMAGGFDVLKDVPKTLVFALSRYRNSLSPVIPESVITRPPSAELAPDQKDEDNLPPYEVLDRILELYIEEDQGAEAIVAAGFAREDVYRVIRLVDLNEYKRRQAPIGVRITRRGFGRDRRYPVTNGWRAGD
ncbi:MAG: NAD+ synthase [Porticoccaceae bacterium]|jgi:NAD+ synthase (glutamine-hydrolysing)|nr:NAD+ synthase [Porticoccaceae bacterium]